MLLLTHLDWINLIVFNSQDFGNEVLLAVPLGNLQTPLYNSLTSSPCGVRLEHKMFLPRLFLGKKKDVTQ